MGHDDYSDHVNRNHSYGYDFHHKSQSSDIKEQIISKLRSNPALRKWFFLAATFLVVVVVALIVVLAPLMLKFMSYVSANGMEGVVNTLWNGSK